MKCEYCFYYKEAGDRRRIPMGENSFYYERFCRVERKYVEKSEKACVAFLLTKDFWCNTDTCWIDVCACINRQTKNKCGRCKQGREILNSARRKEGTKNNIVKRGKSKLSLKRRTVEGKPSIKRREVV